MRQLRQRGQRGLEQRKRRGAAVAELAICLPVITLLVFGAIETADLIHLKGYLHNVSYEGGREAARYNSESADVLTRMSALLDAIPVKDATILIELPGNATNVDELDRGSLITVRVSAPAKENTLGPLKLYSDLTITAEVIVVRE